jgi:hypothetical protein
MRERLTVVDDSFNITRSVIALGEYDNIEHAKEIVAMLIMQAGNPITLRDAAGRPGVIMSEDLGLPEAPADSALRFYTEFANPVKPIYSWNRSLPSSRGMFLRGDLALYLGFGSELLPLQEENPNLNFDMAPVPQVRDSTLATTFGRLYAVGLVKQTDNLAGAFAAATILSGREAAGFLKSRALLPCAATCLRRLPSIRTTRRSMKKRSSPPPSSTPLQRTATESSGISSATSRRGGCRSPARSRKRRAVSNSSSRHRPSGPHLSLLGNL